MDMADGSRCTKFTLHADELSVNVCYRLSLFFLKPYKRTPCQMIFVFLEFVCCRVLRFIYDTKIQGQGQGFLISGSLGIGSAEASTFIQGRGVANGLGRQSWESRAGVVGTHQVQSTIVYRTQAYIHFIGITNGTWSFQIHGTSCKAQSFEFLTRRRLPSFVVLCGIPRGYQTLSTSQTG